MDFGSTGQQQSFGHYPGALSPSTSGSYFYGGGGGAGQNNNTNNLANNTNTSFGAFPGSGGQQSSNDDDAQPSLGGVGQQSSSSFFYPGMANNDHPEQALTPSTSGSHFYPDTNNHNTTNNAFGGAHYQHQHQHHQHHHHGGGGSHFQMTPGYGAGGLHHHHHHHHASGGMPMMAPPLPNQLMGAPRDGDIVELVPAFDTVKRVQAVAETLSSQAVDVDASRPVYLSVGEKKGDHTQRFRVNHSIDGYVGSSSLEPLAAPSRAIAVANTRHIILGDKNDKSGTVSFWFRPAGIPGTFLIQPAAVSGQNISVTSNPNDSSKLQLSLSQADPRSQFQQFRLVKSDASLQAGQGHTSHYGAHISHSSLAGNTSFTAMSNNSNNNQNNSGSPASSSSASASASSPLQQQQNQQPIHSGVVVASTHLLDDSTSSAPNFPNPQIQGSTGAPKNEYKGPAQSSAPPGQLTFNEQQQRNATAPPPAGPAPLQGTVTTSGSTDTTNQQQRNGGDLMDDLFGKSSSSSSKQKSSASDEESSSICVVCLTEKKTHCFLPCRHLCCCSSCATHFKKGSPCPICRTKCDSIIKIFA